MDNHKHNLVRDLGVIVLSILVAVVLVKTGAFQDILTSTKGTRFAGSFVAGLLFTSVFTAAPATAALAELARANSLIVVSLIGGLGALVGDLLIFRFVKTRISEDFSYLIKVSRQERLASIFKLKLFKWLIPFLGALVVASPLPDELGLALLGLSKTKTFLFIPLSFVLNFIGILIIGLITRSI